MSLSEEVAADARREAARLVREAVGGDIGDERTRELWPLEEGLDPSVDALALRYFRDYAPSVRRGAADAIERLDLLDLADRLASGEPLPRQDLRRSDQVLSSTLSAGRLFVLAVGAAALVLYLAVRYAGA